MKFQFKVQQYQVVEAKGEDVSDDVFAAIDRSVPFPIIFEINRDSGGESQTRVAAAHKRLRWPERKLRAYFSGPWLPKDATRSSLPPALDLVSLYSGLLIPMLPVATRAGEHLAEATERVRQARRLEREVATLVRRLRTEPQLNRKVELRCQLKEREARLVGLTDPALRNAQIDPRKNAQWRS